MNILIVDDSLFFRTIVKKALETIPAINYLQSVSGGETAIKLAKGDQFDLIVLDLEMPGIDGQEVIRNIRQFNQTIIILVFSSFALSGKKRTIYALAAGANDFLTKPEMTGKETNPYKILRDVLFPKIEGLMLGIEKKESKAIKTKDLPTDLRYLRPKVICFAVSSGRSTNLPQIFAQLNSKIKVPIIIIEQGSGQVSKLISEDLASICSLKLKQIKEGDELKLDSIFFAPNDKNLKLVKKGEKIFFKFESVKENSSSFPSVQGFLKSASECFNKESLFIISTTTSHDFRAGVDFITKKELPIISIEGTINLGEDVRSFPLENIGNIINGLCGVQVQRTFQEFMRLSEEGILAPQNVFEILYQLTNNDYTQKYTQLIALIISRMKENSIINKEDYFNLVKSNSEERDKVLSLATNHSTRWFRHNEHFVHLKKIIQFKLDTKKTLKLNILSAGCSVGKEAYSLSLMLYQIGLKNKYFQYRIDGFDIDDICIKKAKACSYDNWESKEIPKVYLKLIEKGEGQFTLSEKIKNICKFEKRNIVDQVESEKIYDFIFCRYVLLYFTKGNVENIINNLSKKLRPSGVLFIGEGELLKHKDFKKVLDGVYQKISS